MKTLLWCFFSPIGRLSRQEFILAYGLILIVNFVVLHLIVGSGEEDLPPQSDSGKLIAVVVILQGWPLYALMWKRLQDMDFAGFWAIPAGSGVVALLFVSPAFAGMALIAGLSLLAIKRGTVGDNPFGPDPVVKAAPQVPGSPAG